MLTRAQCAEKLAEEVEWQINLIWKIAEEAEIYDLPGHRYLFEATDALQKAADAMGEVADKQDPEDQ